jgi:hypothetical protein
MSNLKAAFITLIGLIIASIGIYILYYYVANLENTNFLILILSLAIISFGVFIIVKVGKSGETIFVDFGRVKIKDEKNIMENKENFIDRNAKLSGDWAKTVEKRDKLKSLKIAAAAEEENK